MAPDDDDPPEAETDDDRPLTEAEVPNAASPRQVRRATERARRSKDKAADFWTSVLADPVGRREIWDMLIQAGTFNPMFACGPTGVPQPEATWFAAGQREFGLALYHKLMVIDPAAIIRMHQDHDPRFKKPARAPKQEVH